MQQSDLKRAFSALIDASHVVADGWERKRVCDEVRTELIAANQATFKGAIEALVETRIALAAVTSKLRPGRDPTALRELLVPAAGIELLMKRGHEHSDAVKIAGQYLRLSRSQMYKARGQLQRALRRMAPGLSEADVQEQGDLLIDRTVAELEPFFGTRISVA